MTKRYHAIICSWCNETIRKGDGGLPATHSICGTCSDGLNDELTASIARQEALALAEGLAKRKGCY